MRRPTRIVTVTVTVVALSAMTGSLPATAATATYGDCRVTAVKPEKWPDDHHLRGFGIIDCDRRHILKIVARLQYRRFSSDPWDTPDEPEAVVILGPTEEVYLRAIPRADCPNRTAASWRTKVVVTISGSEKPAVISKTFEC
jgi:hypothetical protein